MPGVGDELLLLLRRPHDRVDGTAREQHHEYIHQPQAHRVGNAGPDRQRLRRAQLLIAVEEHRHIASPALIRHAVAVAAVKAVARTVAQRRLQIRVRVRLRHGGDVRKILAGEIPVRVEAQVKIARGKRRFGGEQPARRLGLGGRREVAGVRPVRRCGQRAGDAVSRDIALIFADHVEHAVKIAAGRDKIRRVHDQTQHQQHHRDRQHRDADKFCP